MPQRSRGTEPAPAWSDTSTLLIDVTSDGDARNLARDLDFIVITGLILEVNSGNRPQRAARPRQEALTVLFLMSNTDGLRVAVVGCGYWGSKHVRVLHAADAVDEVVLVDSSVDRLRSLARSYKHAPAYTDLRSAL